MTDRELGTVLCALRFLQRHHGHIETTEQDMLNEIRTGNGAFKPLSTEEIDGLCERLNDET